MKRGSSQRRPLARIGQLSTPNALPRSPIRAEIKGLSLTTSKA
jgi:hypothetical protein